MNKSLPVYPDFNLTLTEKDLSSNAYIVVDTDRINYSVTVGSSFFDSVSEEKRPKVFIYYNKKAIDVNTDALELKVEKRRIFEYGRYRKIFLALVIGLVVVIVIAVSIAVSCVVVINRKKQKKQKKEKEKKKECSSDNYEAPLFV